MLITWISTKWNRKCGRLLLWSSSHSKFYMDFGVEMFNKVRLTYFTRLRSCGNSFTLFKGSDIGWTQESYQNCVDINQVLGGSESVMWYAYRYPLLLCWWTDFLGSLGPVAFPILLNQAGSKGRGRGGSSSPRNFQTWIKFCYKSGIFLLKWTAVNGS